MDTEIGPGSGQGQALSAADRDVLIAIIAQLQATVLEQQRVIERLQRRIAELEGQAKPGGPPRMPGLKAKSGRKPPAQQGPRKQRRHGFARRHLTPTHRVEHVMENCPDCGAHRSGGWIQRTREVIALPQVPVQVAEHVYLARTCPACRRRCTPPAELDGVVLGQQRRGVNLLSLIATLREEGRRPIRSVQWYLDTVHQLRLSVGAIVSAIHRTAQRAQPAVAAILDRIRASPVVHADETGWRQHGANGYMWTSSTPNERYFPCSSQGQALRRGRGKTVVDQARLDEALSDAFSGVLVSDFYAAYHYDGPKQRCWAHPCSSQGQALLRDIHDLRTLYPDAAPLARWADAVHGIYDRAKACTHPQAKRRRTAQLALERQLLALCQPFRHDPSATQAKLCRRIERHIKELFVFVAEPAVPSDNNAAERSLRHLVVSRKISGGTRSEQGTNSKLTLASIFGTWRVQGLNPLTACQQLLISPQL